MDREVNNRFGSSEPFTQRVLITVDGCSVQAYLGETIAAALYAAGIHSWRVSRQGERRGLLCGMGICYDCLLSVNGNPHVRACQELVKDGQVIVTGLAQGAA
jgi:predicted molibdopterin-dependent oxidoreductase YjgC